LLPNPPLTPRPRELPNPDDSVFAPNPPPNPDD